VIPTEPVEKLVKLLAEEKQLGEKIQTGQVVLSKLKKAISESLVNRTMEGDRDPMEEDLMKREQSYERLLQALVDIKTQMQTQIRSLEEQIVGSNIEYVKEMFEQHSNMLGECLAAIDQKVLDCRSQFEEYKRAQSELESLNERLSRLGAESLRIPDPLPTSDIGEILKQRIDQLRSEGRF
jgi:DNA repair exonuclease SbcCD ATPase subunit